ncbi:Methanogen homoaconitase large subunit [Sulfuracidifex tepidarius]|uniref:Methanogen homoaconitase large subunit n=1 Tax=Sulfuracidifex tepidarius TaxID=1294262 RepID=A0A510DTM9_9CREN|nr:aconitate hydratase AcnA [Sulfuracidifex tepidarius]BBG23525.1 Methanogen homoaconitase large subunit [Sulfuracidifex tepidarius]
MNTKKIGDLNFVQLPEETRDLPYSLRVLAENSLRNGFDDSAEKILNRKVGEEIRFLPTRIVMQDYTGVPLLVDLAEMRSEAERRGSDPLLVNPKVRSDLVIDHSVQVDYYGTSYALEMNMKKEFERNMERYGFLKWAQSSFTNLRVVPPGNGIIHQVNLEFLSSVIDVKDGMAFPEVVIGTDSHTTMIGGIGVLGWGVGGLEAEGVMLGEPYYMNVPEVVGVKIEGSTREGVTPTDVVLFLTELLRGKGVVGKFVEFFGDLSSLPVPDRATISNMAPEYGATVGYFPIDGNTLSYLRGTARNAEVVEKVSKEMGIFYSNEPRYDRVIEVDLGEIEPAIAGPRNPEERIPLKKVKESVSGLLGGAKGKTIDDGSVVIAAITSCTNTSNPSVMIGAGILAKKAVSYGMRPKPYVKTSMAPGSPVVVSYLSDSGLLPYLESIGFHVVGFGCTTCIGNAGPLPKEVENDVKNGVSAFAVLSGNRNFEGRINPYLKGAFLASPELVVAYSLAGRMTVDLTSEPIGVDPNGKPVYLKDIWPSNAEIAEVYKLAMRPEIYEMRKEAIFHGDENWEKLHVKGGTSYSWEASSYIVEPPWFSVRRDVRDIKKGRILLLLGDKVTTDHISPAGPILPDSPAGRLLSSMGVTELNTYGARRGNHEIMMRGGFSNPKLRNFLVDRQGGFTKHFPDGEEMSVYDAAMRYMKEGVDTVVVAGKQYGTGSSRDWAAKVTYLLGVKAVLAESFERIHRSNLVFMGVVPIEIPNWKDLGISGKEEVTVSGLNHIKPRSEVEVTFSGEKEITVKGKVRVDNEAELNYLKEGGILYYVFDKMIKK